MAENFEREIIIKADKAIASLGTVNLSIDKLNANLDAEKKQLDSYNKTLEETAKKLGQVASAQDRLASTVKAIENLVAAATTKVRTLNEVLSDPVLKSFRNNFKIDPQGFGGEAAVRSVQKIFQQAQIVTKEMQKQIDLRVLMNAHLSDLPAKYQEEISKLQQIELNMESIQGTNIEAVRTRELELAVIRKQITAIESRAKAEKDGLEILRNRNRLSDPVISERGVGQQAKTIGGPFVDSFKDEAAVDAFRKQIDGAVTLNEELERQAILRARLNKNLGNDHLTDQQQLQIQRYNVMIESLQRLAGANRAAAGGVQASIAQLEKQRDALEKGHKAVQNVTVSWESFQRLVLARVITSVFYNLQNAIFSTVGTADDLLIRLGEIQTIIAESAQNPQGLEQSLNTIYEISNKLNFKSIDVATGYYEALSNQVGETDFQIQQFLESAGGLAKVTRSTLAQSSDALASAVNAYGLSVNDLDEVSNVFFNLVDDGRFRLEEIANTFGSVAVIASQLGITLPDVGAALATISIKGVNAATSQTLLRNVMLSLVKPSKAMNELFDEWGVASGEAALATFGFGGVLDKFNTLADQGAEAVGDVFRNVRSIRGAMGLSGEALEKFNATYAKMIGSQEQYDKALNLVFTNSGEIVSRRLNQIQNDAQQAAVKFVQLAGVIGANDYVAGFVTGTGKIVAGLAAIGAAMAAGQFVAKQYSATMIAAGFAAESAIVKAGNAKALGLIGAGLATAAIAYTFFAKSADQRLAEIEQRNQEAARSFRKDFTEKLINESKAAAAEFNNNLTLALQKVAEKVSSLNAEVKELELAKLRDTFLPDLERMKDALSSDDLSLGKLDGSVENLGKMGIVVNETTKALKDQRSELEKISKELQDQLKTSNELLNKNQRDSFKGGIDRQLQFVQGPAKAQAQAQVAGQFLNGAQNAQNIDAARSAIEDARKYLQEAEQTAFATGALGSPEQHLQFFNQRFAEIDAAEQQIESRFQNNLKTQRNQAIAKFDDIDAEIAKREDLIKSFEREATMYKFFQDKIELIRKQKLDAAKESEQINGVMNQARGVLQPDAVASLQLDSSLSAKKAELEAKLAEQSSLIKSGNDLVAMYQDQQNAQQALTAAMQETQGRIESLKETLLQSVPDFLISGTIPAASDIPGALTRIQADAEVRATPVDSIDPVEFAKQVNEFFRILTAAQKIGGGRGDATSNPQDPERAARSLASIKAVASQAEVINQTNTSVENLNKAVEETNKVETDRLRILNNLNTIDQNSIDKRIVDSGPQAVAGSSEGELPLATVQDAMMILAGDLGAVADDTIARYQAAIQQLDNATQKIANTPPEPLSATPMTPEEAQQFNSEKNGDFQRFIDEAVAFLQAENAAKAQVENKNLINGMPAWMIQAQNNGPMINGRPASEVVGPQNTGPMINGRPASEVVGETINSVSRSAIPQAMADGSQAIPQAMAAGSPAISQAVVNGMAEAFRRNQIAAPARVAGPPDNYYATGGPVGTDTVRAWLTPGEFVVNAQATRKHIRELQAINVGRAPQYYAKGGSVSQTFNNNFNVQSDNPQQSVGKIARAIKRQVRQGKISLQQGLVY